MNEETLQVEISDGVATVWLNRPEVHNAFDDRLVERMTEALRELGLDDNVTAIVLRGRGKSFSAGGDLGWMRRMADFSFEENFEDALGLAGLMGTLANVPQPTIAVVHGAAIGGGLGLIAACDIAVASAEASFRFSEVRLGLIPATISPYVIKAMGERTCRRYFLTAESFPASVAQELGLVHEVVPADRLDQAVEDVVRRLRKGAPEAQRAAKELIATVAGRPIDDAVIRTTAERIARQRATSEARALIAAFLAKQKPPA